jgi:hypothetical protein
MSFWGLINHGRSSNWFWCSPLGCHVKYDADGGYARQHGWPAKWRGRDARIFSFNEMYRQWNCYYTSLLTLIVPPGTEVRLKPQR